MESALKLVNRTYASGGLAAALLQSLRQAGSDIEALTPRDLLPFDELHVMGRQATLDLGRLAGLTPGMRVLDLGAGVGGAARSLSAAFGCRVCGVDLSWEFAAAAAELTRCTNLSAKADFLCADAMCLPFADNSFDAVLMFHLNMNIADKTGLFQEARRVLKRGCRLALWEICRGAGEVVYPVPWARDEAFSFLAPLPELSCALASAGFADAGLEDASDQAAEWVRARLSAPPKAAGASPRLNLDLIMPEFRQRRANISRNLMAGSVRIVRGLALKPAAGP